MAGQEAGEKAIGGGEKEVTNRIEIGKTKLEDLLTAALLVFTHAHEEAGIDLPREVYLAGGAILLARILAMNLKDIPRESEALQIAFQLPLLIEVERSKMLMAQAGAGGGKPQ